MIILVVYNFRATTSNHDDTILTAIDVRKRDDILHSSWQCLWPTTQYLNWAGGKRRFPRTACQELDRQLTEFHL